MGKRSDFERVAKDYYRTFDPRAGKALEPFLEENYTYAEPFCGRGDLIKQLSGTCTFASDIEPDEENNDTGLTFVTKSYIDVDNNDLNEADYIITNPPWSRPLLHHSIEHFASMKPTWFLFDANWMFTNQAERYLDKYCTKIVTIGRLKWIEGTTMSGKDDCVWYLFVPNKTADDKIEFHGKRK